MSTYKLNLWFQRVMQAHFRQGWIEIMEKVLLGISKPTSFSFNRRENSLHARRNKLKNIKYRAAQKGKEAREHTG